MSRDLRFYCSPSGDCRWLMPLVADSKYPSWDDLTDLSLDDLADEIERRIYNAKLF